MCAGRDAFGVKWAFERGAEGGTRITSYNVCYTKLLRWVNAGEIQRNERQHIDKYGGCLMSIITEISAFLEQGRVSKTKELVINALDEGYSAQQIVDESYNFV